MVDVLMGRSVLVTGTAENDDGSLRVYIGPRYHHRYVVIDDPADAAEVRRAWCDSTRHLFIARPDEDQVFVDEAALRGRNEA